MIGPEAWRKTGRKAGPDHLTGLASGELAELDLKVCEFIESLWREGEPKAYASDTISGLGHFIPACKRSLVGSWRLHGSWTRAELPERALPLTPMMAYALAQLAYNHGWNDLSILILLGFSVFARTGELFQARAGDFVFDRQFRRGVWSLPLTKSGQRAGIRESLTIQDHWLLVALQQYCRNLHPGDTLRSVSPQLMRQRYKSLLDEANLPEGFAFYSLRRGGATHAFRTTNSLSAVCLTGRWSHEKTARIYITDALAQLTEINLEPRVQRKLLQLARQARPDFAFD
eukprot:Skav206711  [mRNA]  locus=scaffold3267:5256:11979:+ [translate_table: standard]